MAPPVKPEHEIVFPPPPATPRMRWVAAYARIEDIRPPTKGFFRKAMNFVLGRSDPAGSMFTRPYGLAARDGILAVADSEGSAAVIMDLGVGDVWRLGGTVEGRLVSPIGAAIDRLAAEVKALASQPAFRAEVTKLGFTPVFMPSAEVSQLSASAGIGLRSVWLLSVSVSYIIW